ncbi:acyl-CoA carboxylase subunit epsilon [Dactylosporangium sucinum]|uniref:acyl-CoA carboxylase subunit epsilon n=2 Tax=Dactylosporangium sucinum TaxID=1424081 RepID=UPI0027E5BA5C|nr:acyl-CoA carboxylase subunit epsilon [Dactylosporangium sucinum]
MTAFSAAVLRAARPPTPPTWRESGRLSMRPPKSPSTPVPSEYAPLRCAYARRTTTFRELVREDHVSEEPLFKVVRGTPTAEEVAAIVGALFSLTPAAPPARPARSRWRESARPGARPRWR